MMLVQMVMDMTTEEGHSRAIIHKRLFTLLSSLLSEVSEHSMLCDNVILNFVREKHEVHLILYSSMYKLRETLYCSSLRTGM
jgi:hypothetical protein